MSRASREAEARRREFEVKKREAEAQAGEIDVLVRGTEATKEEAHYLEEI